MSYTTTAPLQLSDSGAGGGGGAGWRFGVGGQGGRGAGGAGGPGCVWTKARSTLALPVWHCMGTRQGSLEQKLPIRAAFCRGTGFRFRYS